MDSARWLLPAEAYWSKDWYELEQERLFGRVWTMVGTVEDAAAGLIAEVAGRTVAVSRATDGALSVSRGAVDVWAGYVFVTLDPASVPALASWLGDFPDRIGGFKPDELVEVTRYRFELAANWKFFVENHVDVYHLWYLHGDSLGAYDHPRAAWDECGPHWVFYEPPRAGVDTGDAAFWRGMVPLPGIGEERWGSGAHLIFPNLTLATGAGFFMTYQVSPLAPDRSAVDIRVRAVEGADASAMLGMSKVIIEQEDGAACEAMQAAVRSPWFGVGPMAAEHELPITRFQEHVLEAIA